MPSKAEQIAGVQASNQEESDLGPYDPATASRTLSLIPPGMAHSSDPYVQTGLALWMAKVAEIQDIVQHPSMERRHARIAELRRDMQDIAQALPLPVQAALEQQLVLERTRRAQLRRSRLQQAQLTGPHVVVDCSFAAAHCRPGKETMSLAKQVEWAMAFNRRSERPVCLHTTSWHGPVAAAGAHICSGTWDVVSHEGALLDVFPSDQLVVLSPDADEPLLELEHPGKFYVLGGIVDRTVRKGITASFAATNNLPTKRLPVKEFAAGLDIAKAKACISPVLNVSDVAIALIEFHRTGDWQTALDRAIPQRKRRPDQARCRKHRAQRSQAAPQAPEDP